MRGLLVIMVLFVMRLFYIQVLQHDHYVSRARHIQVQPLSIVPERGQIYAMDGEGVVPLVLNEKVYTVFVDQKTITDSDAIRQTLRATIGGSLSSEAMDNIHRGDNRYVVIARNITRQQAEAIEKRGKTYNHAGLGLQQTTRRVYPEGALAAQTLGYVNSDGQGQYGVEGQLDKQLAGTPGMLETVTDVNRIPLTIGNDDVNVPAKDGDDIVLTIDRTVQLKAEEILRSGLDKVRATKGSIVVLDPTSGDVMAMASYPTYDPEHYTKVEDYQAFQNPVISLPYENGSVIKALTMGAGLDSGAVTRDSTFNDSTGCTQIDDRKICNVEEDPRQATATMTDTLHYSLNTGVVHILRQMGNGTVNKQARQTLYEYFHDKYRFGQKTGIELAGESPGVVIAPSEAEGNNVRYANMTFGQGMDLTMIQTASAFASEVNGGIYYQPRVVAGVRRDDGTMQLKQPVVLNPRVIAPEVSATARQMIHEGRTLGMFGSADRPGYMIGGKTGTSQVIDPRTGEYSDDNSIGSYLGFGGVTTPRYVIMVRVDDAKSGGYEGTTAAGPIFNNMSDWMIDYLQLAPITKP